MAVTKLAVQDLELDLLTRKVHRAGKKLELQLRDYSILRYLMEHVGKVVTRKMLLENVWDYNLHPQTNLIEMNLCCLRRKVDKPFPQPLIHTVRGSGYIMQADNRRWPT